MYISINWIKQYVNLDGISTEELKKRFMLSTAEIEDVISKGSDISGVIFARVNKVENHPNSVKLHVLEIDTGIEKLQVVCGAPNVREGMITAFAKIGAFVCGTKIGKAKLAGVESFGMCCSEKELGIGSDESGIMDILENVKIGQDIKEVFPIDDIIFEVDNKSLTNRPDLWGHYGIAREFAAIFDKKLKPLQIVNLEDFKELPKLSLKVENQNCLRYSSISASNISKNRSNQEIKIRLNYCGMRDINLLTDLTNYLMLELGQPMHAFDNSLVKGIMVKSATKTTKMLTLEGGLHDVPENSILICDSKGEPCAIAGIKGGKLSGITDSTNSLLLESATFDATTIRKTSTKIGLKTDSSLRYEKSIDPEMTTLAIARFVYLLKKLDPKVKVTSSLTDVYNFKYPKINIDIKTDFVQKRTGLIISEKSIIEILNRLEFKTEKMKDFIRVYVPSFRATKDISIKEDLVEEIARMFGYDNISPQTIKTEVKPINQILQNVLEYKTKYLLAEKFGLNEVHSYIWNYADFNKSNKIEQDVFVSLVDSSNSGQAGIRNNLVPSLLKIFHENKNSFDEIKIFEIGRVAASLDKSQNVIEEKRLAIILASQTKTDVELYFELKKIIQNISSTIIKTKVSFNNSKNLLNYFHPTNSSKIVCLKEEIGLFGILHPQTNLSLDKRFKIAILEIDFSKFCENANELQEKFKPISKFQDVNLDFNFNISNNFTYDDVEKIINQFRTKLNCSFKLVDVFEDEKGRYWNFRFNISSNEKTLSSNDLEDFSKRLIEYMTKNSITLKG